MNKNLHNAKRNKNDEFYTQLSDIEKELSHYKDHFRDKVVLCNCDDPKVSNFFRYFSLQFHQLGLRKLITTCYKNQEIDLFSKNDNEEAIYLEYDGTKNKNGVPSVEEIGIKHLKGDGDFRSKECVELLEQADIVVTNPPFSLFREFVALLIKYGKEFLIIGHMANIIYKDIAPLLKDGKIWVGYHHNIAMEFRLPNHYEKWSRIDKKGNKYGKVPGITWFTNLPHKKRNEELILVKKYEGNEKYYPKYDNYDAIEVGRVVDIPKDYNGVMGIPITFLGKYNPKQFEILGVDRWVEGRIDYGKNLFIAGKEKYNRILIKRK